MVKNTDDRVKLRPDRVKHWISVGALPREKVGVLLKKYMDKWEKVNAEAAALPPWLRRRPHKRRNTAFCRLRLIARTASWCQAFVRARSRKLQKKKNMRFDLLTLFPDLFQGYLRRACSSWLWPRGWWKSTCGTSATGSGKHKSVDDRPFGGGPGMVIMPEPVYAAVEDVQTWPLPNQAR